jgi:imidazolonepropionase-like amidohydrolase
MLDARCSMLDARCSMLDARCSMLAILHLMQVRGRDRFGSIFGLALSAECWAMPDGSDLLDLGDLFCLPGLIDAHAHLSGDDLELGEANPSAIVARARAAAEAGVAACLDKGWDDDTVLELVANGSITRPRVAAAGTMLRSADGYWDGFGRVVDDDGLAAEVERMAPGRPWVKIVGDWPRRGRGALANFGEEALAAAVAAAHRGGARVAVHTMAPGVASAAVRAGVDSIEHGLFLDVDDLVSLADRGGVWVPTVLRVEEVAAGMKPGSSGAELLGRGLENLRALLPVAAEIGVTVMSGSDLAIASGLIGREVAALTRFGLPVEAAIEGASEVGAAAVGLESGFRPGMPADLVAYGGDPLADLSVLEQPVVVISGGVVVADRR